MRTNLLLNVKYVNYVTNCAWTRYVMSEYIIDHDKLVVCREDFSSPYEWRSPSQKAHSLSES